MTIQKEGALMHTKSMLVDIKADATALVDGQFTGYASVFGNRDSYGDVVVKGAFAESLAEYGADGAGIPCYWSHRMDDPDMNIGVTLEAKEDDHGLFVKVQLDLDTPKGLQVHRLIKAGRVKQMSFAYDVLEYVDGHNEEHGWFTELRKLRLHEVSVVPIGANQATELLDVKDRLTRVKGGRSISAKNEEKLQQAADLINEVLSSNESPDESEGESPSGEEPKSAKSEEPETAKGEERAEVKARTGQLDTDLAFLNKNLLEGAI